MAEGNIDHVGRHSMALDLLPPVGELFQRVEPVAIEEAGQPHVGNAGAMSQIEQFGISAEGVG
jgi:hypothetical protein